MWLINRYIVTWICASFKITEKSFRFQLFIKKCSVHSSFMTFQVSTMPHEQSSSILFKDKLITSCKINIIGVVLLSFLIQICFDDTNPSQTYKWHLTSVETGELHQLCTIWQAAEWGHGWMHQGSVSTWLAGHEVCADVGVSPKSLRIWLVLWQMYWGIMCNPTWLTIVYSSNPWNFLFIVEVTTVLYLFS